MTLRATTAADWPEIQALLRSNSLPEDGFVDSVSAGVVACKGDRVIGAAGLEFYADGALLRSVVVSEEARGRGIGQQLTRAAFDIAKGHGVTDVYLLTTTAGEFFPRLGFAPIDRASVPASVQQSAEFQGACPASALVMKTRLG
jgi:amino-acid N-acetyltransferase